MVYNNIEDLPDHVLYEALLAYQREFFRREKMMNALRRITDEENIYDGPIGKMGIYPSEKNEKSNYNDDIESLRKQVNFWKSGYFRLSKEIKQMLDQRSSDSLASLQLYKAKETVDILSDKLILYKNELDKRGIKIKDE